MLALVGVAGLALLARADITLDNFTADPGDDAVLTADAARAFAIVEGMGRRPLLDPADPDSKGPNLFHSFLRFSLAPDEIARFTQEVTDGSDPISNVIARVTGGLPSTINGGIVSEIAGADFWFVNPAGVMFGAGAFVDVAGSFNASAGDFVVFGSGETWPAFDSAAVLSVASPVEFGFLATGGGVGTLTVDGVILGGTADVDVPDRFDGLYLHGRDLTIATDAGVGTRRGEAARGDLRLHGEDSLNVRGRVMTATDRPGQAGDVTLTGGSVTLAGAEVGSTTTARGGIKVVPRETFGYPTTHLAVPYLISPAQGLRLDQR
jgi:filamentous hemagglutinin family protein